VNLAIDMAKHLAAIDQRKLALIDWRECAPSS
jgi:hypothetical protein